MHFEIEQKFWVDDFGEIVGRLRELGGTSTKPVQQNDMYFNHPARDFAVTDEALRLRQVGEANSVTYKGPKLDATTKTRRELELPLTSGAAAVEEFSELLMALGFRKVASVQKTRLQWKVPFEGRTVEAAIDHVTGLGMFVELELFAEGAADGAEVEGAKGCVASLAEALGLSKNERRSYLELLLAQKKTPGESAGG